MAFSRRNLLRITLTGQAFWRQRSLDPKPALDVTRAASASLFI